MDGPFNPIVSYPETLGFEDMVNMTEYWCCTLKLIFGNVLKRVEPVISFPVSGRLTYWQQSVINRLWPHISRSVIFAIYSICKTSIPKLFISVHTKYPQEVIHLRKLLTENIQSIIILGSSIRTPLLIQGRLEHTEINLMHFIWEVTWAHGNHPISF